MIVKLIELDDAKNKIEQFLVSLPEILYRQRFIHTISRPDGAKLIMNSHQSLVYLTPAGDVVGLLEMSRMGAHKRDGVGLSDCSPLSAQPGVCALLFAEARVLYPDTMFACYVKDYANVPLFRYLTRYVDVLLHPLLHAITYGPHNKQPILVPYWTLESRAKYFAAVARGLGRDDRHSIYHALVDDSPDPRSCLISAATIGAAIGIEANKSAKTTIVYKQGGSDGSRASSTITDIKGVGEAILVDARMAGYSDQDQALILSTLATLENIKYKSMYVGKYRQRLIDTGLIDVVADLEQYVDMDMDAFNLTMAGAQYVVEHSNNRVLAKHMARAIQVREITNLQLIDPPYSLYADLYDNLMQDPLLKEGE